MSLGVPGRLVDVLEGDVHLARADVSGVLRTIGVGVLGDEHLVPGDWVLIHAGTALSKINEDEAGRVRACLQLLDRPCADEVESWWCSQVDEARGG